MEQLIKRSDVFRRSSRRKRLAKLIFILSALTAINLVNLTLQAAAQDNAFSKLKSRPGLLLDDSRADGTSRYVVVGGSETFEFTRNGRQATIRFLCPAFETSCTPQMRASNPLSSDPGGRGDMVFKSRGGITVLRMTATGGATLFGGAPFVPRSIPRSGRPVERAY